MRALFITNRWPGDFDRFSNGTAVRMLMMLEAVASLASHVDLLFFAPPKADLEESTLANARERIRNEWGLQSFSLNVCRQHFSPLRYDRLWSDYLAPALDARRQPMLAATSGPEHSRALQACLDKQPDLIFVHRLTSMMPLLKARRPLPPVYMDLDDIEHLRFSRILAEPPHWRSKKLLKLQVPALARLERCAVGLTEKSFVCSKSDADFLNRLWHVANVEEVPNTVPDRGSTDYCPEPTLMFLGLLSYRPNTAAAEWLIDEIWPRIRDRAPAARLVIAGGEPEHVRHFSSPPAGVTFSGFVPDLRNAYQGTRIALCPIRSGGGTRVKIVEAASFAKPIVSTVLGAEGLAFSNGTEILLRDSAVDFAAAVVELLQSEERCRQLGLAARRAYEREYRASSVKTIITNKLIASVRKE